MAAAGAGLPGSGWLAVLAAAAAGIWHTEEHAGGSPEGGHRATQLLGLAAIACAMPAAALRAAVPSAMASAGRRSNPLQPARLRQANPQLLPVIPAHAAAKPRSEMRPQKAPESEKNPP